jgi:hypothetical protein
LAAPVHAATVYLLNGNQIDGKLVFVGTEYVTLDIAKAGKAQYLKIPHREIADIQVESGESVYKRELEAARKKVREELRLEAEAKKRLAQEAAGLAAQPATGPTAAPKNEPAPPPVEKAPELAEIEFTGFYEERLLGFSLKYPVRWGTPTRIGHGYWEFRDKTAAGGGVWSFNVTFFERAFEVQGGVDELMKLSYAQLDAQKSYVSLRRGPHLGLPTRAERASGYFRRKDMIIRHEQLIVELRSGNLLIFHFFAPGAPEGLVPEFEAVIKSLKLGST